MMLYIFKGQSMQLKQALGSTEVKHAGPVYPSDAAFAREGEPASRPHCVILYVYVISMGGSSRIEA
jgi:hypothetical protein